MNSEKINLLTSEAVELLKQLITIPSPSGSENKTADCIEYFFKKNNIESLRLLNNVFCVNKYFDNSKPCILLNSHHDTVLPNSKYSNNPYDPKIENGKLYGLGSTDAGASLVSLIATFVHFYNAENLNYNIVVAASAEEEISGKNGIEKLFYDEIFFKLFSHKDSFAIVGEPTQLDLAIAEKGLMVLDCTAAGKAGHAARDDGENAIYNAIRAIEWLQKYNFPEISPLLGAVKMTVTSINTDNKAHNVVPPSCHFVVDIRINELYTHEQILETITQNTNLEIKPRSTRLRSTSIDFNHPIVKAGVEMGKTMFGSPTMSDKALIPLPSLKCGIGSSEQSHSADEFIKLEDIEDGIKFYIELLTKILFTKK